MLSTLLASFKPRPLVRLSLAATQTQQPVQPSTSSDSSQLTPMATKDSPATTQLTGTEQSRHIILQSGRLQYKLVSMHSDSTIKWLQHILTVQVVVQSALS